MVYYSFSFFCSAGRIMEGMDRDNKINLPNGLCARKSCAHSPVCFCCLVTDNCYWTMDDCIESKCGGPSALDTVTVATTRALRAPIRLM